LDKASNLVFIQEKMAMIDGLSPRPIPSVEHTRRFVGW